MTEQEEGNVLSIIDLKAETSLFEPDRILAEQKERDQRQRAKVNRRSVKKAYFIHDQVMCALIDELADLAARGGWPKKRKDIRALKLYGSETQRDSLLDELVGCHIIKREGEKKKTRYSLNLGGELGIFMTKIRASEKRWNEEIKELSLSNDTAEEYESLLLHQLLNILKFAFYSNTYPPKARRFLNKMLPQETDRLVKIISKIRKRNRESANKAFVLARRTLGETSQLPA